MDIKALKKEVETNRLEYLLKLNYRKKEFFFLIHLFARDILLMNKLEIEETKETLYSTFKNDTIKVGTKPC